MTIKELIDNFGSKFGLTIDNPDDYYLNARYLNNVPLEQIWNTVETNPNLEMDSILTTIEDTLWSKDNNDGVEEEAISESVNTED